MLRWNSHHRFGEPWLLSACCETSSSVMYIRDSLTLCFYMMYRAEHRDRANHAKHCHTNQQRRQ